MHNHKLLLAQVGAEPLLPAALSWGDGIGAIPSCLQLCSECLLWPLFLINVLLLCSVNWIPGPKGVGMREPSEGKGQHQTGCGDCGVVPGSKFFFSVLEIELWALYLLGKHFTLVHFLLVELGFKLWASFVLGKYPIT
jgi:hypothetical protein